MRTPRKNNWLAIGVLTAMCWFAGASAHATAATPGSITLTPATLTLTLPNGQSKVQGQFTIANNYATPMTLNLGFTQTVKTPGGNQTVLKQLAVTPATVVIPGDSSASPVVTLTDASTLAPGSQDVDLTITEGATTGNNVAVVASIHMPLVIIKEAGAVTRLSVSHIQKPGFALILPTKTTLTIHNSGNVVAIPRGYATITNPRGQPLSKGIVNTGSVALAPSSQASFTTRLTVLDRAWLPGEYHMHVVYGVGGNSANSEATVSFFYMPVWELLLLIPLAAFIYCCYLLWVEWSVRRALRQKPQKTHKQTGKKGKK